MSSVIVDRITGCRPTNRAPSRRLFHERASVFISCGPGTMNSRHANRTRLDEASSAYTSPGLYTAMRTPAASGPSVAESWYATLRHIAALANSACGTRLVTNACDAGHPKARKTPDISRKPYVNASGAAVHEAHARPAPDAASPTCAVRMSRLRGYRSASAPAGSASSRTGTASTSPTSPRLSGSLVRA